MILDSREEKILKKIRDLGPDYNFRNSFKDRKSQAALNSLIRLWMIEPHFPVSDDQVEKYINGQKPDPDDFDLHFVLTEDGLAYFSEMYHGPYSSKAVLWKIVAAVILGLLAVWGLTVVIDLAR